jgi:hypothetical protein
MTDTTMTTDPNLINKMADEAAKGEAVQVTTVAPANTDVTLPGGFLTAEGALVKYAEVRELNGSDEEAIARAGSTGKVLSAMLQRGLVSIGNEKVGKDDLDRLLSGDRDAILIGIRRVTFGDTVEYMFDCPLCKAALNVIVNLSTDIPSVDLEDPIEGRRFTYMSKRDGEIIVALPTGLTQKRLLDAEDKNRAELNTIVLASCVLSINGVPSLGASSVQKLGMLDRENLINEIITRNPGPRLGEVKATCEACGEVIPMPLSLADLFRL